MNEPPSPSSSPPAVAPRRSAAVVRYRVMTAMTPGAIAIVQLRAVGEAGASSLAAALNGLTHGAVPGRWGLMQLHLGDMAGEQGFAADEAVVAWIDDHRCQIMPHGGVRVVQRLVERLRSLGVEADDAADARDLYPEAATPIEADMLETLSRAASPAAIPLLLDQPRAWSEVAAGTAPLDFDAIARRSAMLDRLIDPPTVVVVGPANVGKSTLTNRLVGRAASLTADLPGTTRDWVSTCVMLRSAALGDDVAVTWLDTPGVRTTEDAIERKAIALARSVITGADLLISLREPGGDWLDEAELGRAADLHVLSKADQAGGDPADDADLRISAVTGEGIDDLAAMVLAKLDVAEPDDIPQRCAPWAFSAALQRFVTTRDTAALKHYITL